MQTKVLYLIIIIVIAVNFYSQALYSFDNHRNFNSPQSCPGQSFASLRPYLKNVSWAGYHTDHRAAVPFADVDNMFPYQQAQFCLSPTLLDYYHPFSHEFIILNYRDSQLAERKIIELHGRIMAVTKEGVVLVRQEQ